LNCSLRLALPLRGRGRIALALRSRLRKTSCVLLFLCGALALSRSAAVSLALRVCGCGKRTQHDCRAQHFQKSKRSHLYAPARVRPTSPGKSSKASKALATAPTELG